MDWGHLPGPALKNVFDKLDGRSEIYVLFVSSHWRSVALARDWETVDLRSMTEPIARFVLRMIINSGVSPKTIMLPTITEGIREIIMDSSERVKVLICEDCRDLDPIIMGDTIEDLSSTRIICAHNWRLRDFDLDEEDPFFGDREAFGMFWRAKTWLSQFEGLKLVYASINGDEITKSLSLSKVIQEMGGLTDDFIEQLSIRIKIQDENRVLSFEATRGDMNYYEMGHSREEAMP